MTDTLLKTTWLVPMQPDRTDAVFYHDYVGGHIGSVTLQHNGEVQTIEIYCEGDIEAVNTDTAKIYQSSYDFFEDGYDTDEKLFSSPDNSDWDENPWFDLYSEDGEHLDCVSHNFLKAQNFAEQLLVENAGLDLALFNLDKV